MRRFKGKCKGVECTPPKEIIDLGTTPYPIENGDRICFCVPTGLESSTDDVVLLINEVEFALKSCATNNVKADQLRNGVTYYTVIGTEEPSARVLNSNDLCPTAFEFPVIPIEPVEETPAEG